MAGMMRVLAALALLAATSQAEVRFNRDIRPIMSDTCFRCHGPDKSSRMAGLRLDLREEALKPTQTGVTPIVPGDPDNSAIIARVFATGAKLMPPKHAHKELSERQKKLLKQWVAEGAKYEGHWAYQPVERPQPPRSGHPVDAFILDRLSREGIQPAPLADKRTLIRRVTLDLTGLPPAPEEVAAFLADTSAEAYRKVVSRLLSSPRFAERQAMFWLDAVRYADTCGFHGDNPFPAWPYRDYVLRSFRDNKPFDQFTREQIAGDLLPSPTDDQVVATAYHRLTRTSAEGGLQPKEYLAKYAADRVRTTSAVWLGSTMGCAECHDHKFDPFTAKDFYAFKAFFADIKEDGFVADRGLDAWGVQRALPTPDQAAALGSLESRLLEARRRLSEASAAAAGRRTDWERRLKQDLEAGRLTWRVEPPVAVATANGAQLKVYREDEPLESVFEWGGSLTSSTSAGRHAIVATGPNPDNETYTVTLSPAAGRYTAVGIEVIQDESLPGVRVARGADRLTLTEVEAEIVEKGRARRAPFSLATAGMFDGARTPDLPAMAAIDGNPKTGWGISMFGDARNLFLALRFAEPLTLQPGQQLRLRLRHDSDYRRATLGRFRIALSQAEYAWPEPVKRGPKDSVESLGITDDARRALAATGERTPAQHLALIEHFRFSDPVLAPLAIEVARLEAEHGLLLASIPHVVVTESDEPRLTRVLPRGNWMDDSGEIVEPAIPAFLGSVAHSGQRATRLDLANWLVSKENPLTARVFVNRTWRQFFGAGLSKVLDDVGSQGELPEHPELLDWLAAEFMSPSTAEGSAHAWDVKHLIWTIVTSDAYQRSSAPGPEAARDPDNRLLARQNRYRVEAESVRDIALAAAGLLHEKFGGPSVRPWQPVGYLAALNFPKRDYSASRPPDTYRRSVYTAWQRTFLNPSLSAFDAPSREECTVNRTASNTPLQALVMLNDPMFVEIARVMAQNMLTRPAASRIDWAFERATSRPPTVAERRLLEDLYRRSLADFRAQPAAARELLSVGEHPLPPRYSAATLAALTNTARAILNLHETITRN
jgi:hypothetical protein